MTTSAQLSNIAPVDGDGSEAVDNGDGTTTTTWPDGTSRVDYADGSAMVTFTDGAVLNIYPDGTRQLNDSAGGPLDPMTGQPLDADVPPPPAYGADQVREYLEGLGILDDPTEAQGLFDAFRDALEGVEDPVVWFKAPVQMALAVWRALETEQRGCYMRGWSYAIVYRVVGQGDPPEPTFQGGILQDAEVADLDRQAWRDGVAAGHQQLEADAAFRNKVMFRFIADNRAPVATVRALYVAACDAGDDWQLKAAYADILGWPEPTGA